MKRSAGISGWVVIGCVFAVAVMAAASLLAGCATIPAPPTVAQTDRAIEIAWNAQTKPAPPGSGLYFIWAQWVVDDCIVPPAPAPQECVRGYSECTATHCRIWLAWNGSIWESALAHENSLRLRLLADSPCDAPKPLKLPLIRLGRGFETLVFCFPVLGEGLYWRLGCLRTSGGSLLPEGGLLL